MPDNEELDIQEQPEDNLGQEEQPEENQEESLDEENPEEQAVNNEAYNELATQVVERNVKIDLPKGGGDGRNSYRQSSETANITDLGRTLATLFPQLPIDAVNRIARSLMIARIAPDVFKDLIYTTITDIVEQLDATGEDFDVQEVISLVYAACSIGLEGMARVEVYKLYGAVNEAEVEKVSKQLGI